MCGSGSGSGVRNGCFKFLHLYQMIRTEPDRVLPCEIKNGGVRGCYNAAMSEFNAPVYEVEKTTGRCALSGKVFSPGEVYVAALVEDGDALRRVDVGLGVWDEGRRPDHLFGYWKAVAPDPREKKKMFVDDEVLLNLLQRLADADQPQRIAFRFVLMLLLMRKKLLRYDATDRKQADDGSQHAWWVLTPKLDLSKGPLGKWNEEEKITVLDPNLDEDGICAVTDQLGEILEAEL